ncbi:hypothetical protein AUEXF2481DRAFT_6477 [Aureobasidium subglaciale EXF-2481]|uniref:Polarized growth protein Boi2 n=1 Tax=Aureobasidium subglaciale (strain EXF-2481) TaxID=1043005 RepID=A0A074YII8_AURSE|nr:uncharacterized protein AUEXF2481DRAFT_6477 [Aureobasidium subglaciale EXF-2481]KAI5208767.1 hypothetical protein E4T38_02738 [Aureobasidium subglaciale]KAI5227540.1 hypothetical protein E4T40_02437 [Aureobasidium subglaciale]KAI5230925.1 hypothetical protein E4T41_02737 [Aureobasidium subglaciale]KAI5265219.1 hypothetical protein E4T46_02515 [Aureobasidium subglaciale]KEQ93907.1 hypothetical protein AUEXF2481DRAFT_6477 [Aureobasidium subglaciale EXF-2481]
MATRQPSDPLQVPPGSILLVVHDFIARSPDELSLAKGDRIELIERDDDFGDGWFLGRHMNNSATGLFPEVYTTPAPRGTLLSTQQPPARRNDASQLNRPQTAASSISSQSSNPFPAQRSSQHNSVMHETLSVIDEHITDMRTPRENPLTNIHSHDTESIYSSHAPNRLSYINGHETDDEENQLHTEAEIMLWSPVRVAEYLEDHGVERSHCDTFREQEISGEVLLTMEQSAIFIKEFELGSVGRRLKTWQKVKALQDEVRQSSTNAPRSVSEYSAAGDDAQSENGRRRSQSVTASPYRPISSMGTPSMTFTRPDTTQRPSAASIRNLGHSRRHSSMGSIDSMNRYSHQRQSSIGTTSGAPATTRRLSIAHEPPTDLSITTSQVDGGVGDYGFGTLSSPIDADRGYFSGNEVDARNKRNVLQKKATSAHTRNLSAATDSARHSASYRNFPRMSSADSMRDPASPIMSPASSHFSFNKPSASRAVSSPHSAAHSLISNQPPISPIVTRLDQTLVDSESSSLNPSPSPASNTRSFFSKPRIGGGLRIASDAVTQNEKKQSALKHEPLASPARTGSTTPSTETRSFDLQKSDNQSRVSTGSSGALAPPPASTRARPKAKSKKSTSAYTRGLEKKPPAQQIADCDYSGWMKKKSSSLVGSWKPRLFVLRGRRLSYYYSENDTEEKGLIDISSHRVLPAENEKMTGLHAALTGAGSSPMVPQGTAAPTADGQGLFIFKLVPPRQGLSKAVNFTKPTVHYFAVNSRQEGRLWMAALMKATIDYDASNGKVTTSYSQNTISLSKARARNERPPALQDTATTPKVVHELEASSRPKSSGLGIAGLDEAQPGAERSGSLNDSTQSASAT